MVLEVAKRHVDEFLLYGEAPRSINEQSTERAACEACLRSGIDSLKWLRSAEQFILEAGRRGVTSIERETAEAIRSQYQSWLARSDSAEAWATALIRSGHEPANLADFSAARQFVAGVIASNVILDAIDAALADGPIELPPTLPAQTGSAGAGTVQIALRRLETIA